MAYKILRRPVGETPTTLTVAKDEKKVGDFVRFLSNADKVSAGMLLYNPRTDELRESLGICVRGGLFLEPNKGGTTSRKWLAKDIVHVLPPKLKDDDVITLTVSIRPAPVEEEEIDYHDDWEDYWNNEAEEEESC